MAHAVYKREPAFRTAFDRCADYCSLPLKRLVFESEKAVLDRTDATQPAVFAVEYALTAMLSSWGVRPDIVLGHSVGEYAAAYAAGMLTAEEACQLVVARGRLMWDRCERGALVAISASEAELALLMHTHPGIEVALENGRRSFVVGGPCYAAERFRASAAAARIPARTLSVSHAFHTRFMDPMLEEFALAAKHISNRDAHGVTFISSVTGGELESTGSRYWVEHVRRPVRFAEALHNLAGEMPDVVIEAGPGRALTTFARREIGKDAAGAWVALLSPEDDEWGAVTRAAVVLGAKGT
jgi:acyl transferase domain-containing protein